MNFTKCYHTIRLMLCKRGGYGRAAYIRKHNLFGAIGDNVYFHPYWMPSDPKRIFIGNNVRIAADVVFINHDIIDCMLNQKYGVKEFRWRRQDIRIGDNVMIGARATILPGAIIHSNCIIGACTVVSKEIPEGSVVVGNPPRIIGAFDEYVEKVRRLNKQK